MLEVQAREGEGKWKKEEERYKWHLNNRLELMGEAYWWRGILVERHTSGGNVRRWQRDRGRAREGE